MSWYSKLSLRTKFVLVTSLLVIAICAGLYLLLDRVFRGYLQTEMQRQAAETALNLESQLTNFADTDQIYQSAKRLLEDRREISRITVYRRVGDYMEPYMQAQAVELPLNANLYRSAVATRTPFRVEFDYKQREYWEFAYPITLNGRVVGLTTITLNFSQYKNFMSAVRTGTLLILILGFILLLICINIYVGMEIQRPLNEIASAMNRVKNSDFDVRLSRRDEDEIGTVVNGFNDMTHALREANRSILEHNQMLEHRISEATEELRGRNLELFEAQDELRRASRLAMAGQIAAMLAHDLGSPLSSISGHLQLMLEDQSRTPEEKERLQLLLTQVERLSDTIRNFLANVSDLKPHFEKVDVNDLLRYMIRLTGPVLSERKIQVDAELNPNIPPILADSNQLQQLFLNLFTNAIDAMKNGGRLIVRTFHVAELDVPAEKQRDLTDSSDWVRIELEDTGAGMDQEHLKNLFRPFFSTKEFGTGTGLGLAICNEIVKAHGGQIQVESQEKKGTRFIIFLPVRQNQGNGQTFR
jgi:two-component system, NtrC family, sensor kinase